MDGSKDLYFTAVPSSRLLLSDMHTDIVNLSKFLAHSAPAYIRTPFEGTMLQLSRDNKSFIVANSQGRLAKCDRIKKEVVLETVLENVQLACLAQSLDGAHLFLGDYEGNIHILLTSDFSVSHSENVSEYPICSIKPSSEETIFIALADGRLLAYRLSSNSYELLKRKDEAFTALDVYNDIVALGCSNGEVLVINEKGITLFEGQVGGAVRSIRIVGLYLAVAYDKEIAVFNTAIWAQTFILKGHTGDVHALDITDNFLISSSGDYTVKVWRLDVWNDEATLHGHTGEVCDVLVKDGLIHSLGLEGMIRTSRIPTLPRSQNFRSDDTLVDMIYNEKLRKVYARTSTNSIIDLDNGHALLQREDIISWCLTSDGNILVVFYPENPGESTATVAHLIHLENVGNFKTVKLTTSSKPTVCTSSHTLQHLITGEMFRITVWKAQDGTLEYIFRSHNADITTMLVKHDHLFAGDATGTIKSYNLKKFDETASFNEVDQQSIKFIKVSKDSKLLFSATDHNLFRIWSIKRKSHVFEHHADESIYDLSFSHDQKHFIVVYAKRLEYWSVKSYFKIFEITFPDKINKHALSYHSQSIVCSFKNFYKVFEDPLQTNNISLYGRNQNMHKFFEYLMNIFEGGVPKYVSRMNSWIIEPFHINMLHIYAYFNLHKHLKSSIKSGIAFFPSKSGYTPLAICLEKNFTECVESILREFMPKLQENPVCFYHFGSTMAKLNKFSPELLHQLYELGFRKSIDNTMPLFCHESVNLPLIKESAKIYLPSESFMPIEKYSTEDRAIEFTQSYFKINVVSGSSESLEFMKGLVECKNLEVFTTLFIRTLIDMKWRTLRWIHYVDFIIYLIYLVCLCQASFSHKFHWLMIVSFVTNQILFLYELFQMISSPKFYFTSFTNYVDITRTILFDLYCAVEFFDLNEQTQGTLFLITVLTSLLRGFGYFRVFEATRWLIYLILEIFYQLWAFILVTAYTIISLAVIYSVSAGDYSEKLKSNLDENKLEWFMLFFIIVVNPLILLNLFISIVGNALERMKDERVVKDRQEIAEMIHEAEILLFWRRNAQKRKFLHMCDEEHANVIVSNSIAERIRVTAEKSDYLMYLFEHSKEEISGLKEMLDEKLSAIKSQTDNLAEAVKAE